MVLLICARRTTISDADSLNGELFSRSEMDVLLTLPSKKMPGDLPDMPQFAKKTDLFQLLNLKS
jgi:hypothetical protein